MSLWTRKGILMCVCLVISCLVITFYAASCYWEQQVVYIGVADGHGNVEITAVKRGIRVPLTSCVPLQHNVSTHTRTPWQVVNASDNKLNVFDTQSSGKYTIVVQTYKRNDLLKRFLGHYNHKSFPFLDQIIVLWNNIGKPLEPTMFQHEISQAAVPVRFLVSRINSVRNKLQPYPQIQTAGM